MISNWITRQQGQFEPVSRKSHMGQSPHRQISKAMTSFYQGICFLLFKSSNNVSTDTESLELAVNLRAVLKYRKSTVVLYEGLEFFASWHKCFKTARILNDVFSPYIQIVKPLDPSGHR